VVTDAGLYQGTDEKTVNVTNVSGNNFFGTSPSDGAHLASGPVTFTWTTDSGAGLYTLYIDGVIRGTTNGTSKTVSGISNGNHTWYVRADGGDITDTLTFKIN
jgi:hypothetical protein